MTFNSFHFFSLSSEFFSGIHHLFSKVAFSSGGWPTIFLQYFDAVGWIFDL